MDRPLRLWWHPLPIGAMILTALNDHVAKEAWPGAVTGKLSDVAGLFFAPLLLTTLAGLFVPAWRASERLVVVSIVNSVVVGLLFSGLQLSPCFAQAAAMTVGDAIFGAPLHITADPTDLIALPSLVLAALWGRHRLRNDGGHLVSP